MRPLACVVAISFCTIAPAQAQAPAAAAPSSSVPSRLPKVVVTPTGTEVAAFDVPYTVEIMERAELREGRLARTLPEALKEMPAVMVQKTAHGQGSPYIRGFTGFRTLMLIDGIRLNNSTFRDGPNQYWSTIDSFSIGRMEMLKGPASVLYGSDAIGGTVNVLSAGRDRFEDGLHADGRLIYRHASAEHAQVGRAEVNGNWGQQFGAAAGFSRKKFGDLRAGGLTGLQPKTGYDEQAGNAKLEYWLLPKARLVAAYQTFRQNDAWRTHRTIFGRSWRGTAVGNDNRLSLDQSRDLGYLQYHQTQFGGAVDAVHVSVSYQRQEEVEDRVRNTNQVNQQGFAVGTAGLSAQLESPTRFGRWVYGAEFYRDRVTSFRRNFRANGTLESVNIQGPVADDARYDQRGAYVQNSFALGRQCEVILGTRHTGAEASAGRIQDPVTGAAFGLRENWRATVSSGRMLWKLDAADSWHLFGGVSQGFRAPNLSDLTRFDIARSGELEVPSPALTPERFTSFEVGVKTHQARVSGHAVYFYTRIADLIDRLAADNPATAGVTEVIKANVGNGDVQGIEMAGQLELHRQWSLWGNLTAMTGEVDTMVSSAPPVLGRRPMSRIMPLSANAGLRWESTGKQVWSEVDATLAARQNRLSPGDVSDTQRIPPGGTPGYSVFHVRAGWRASRNLTFSATLENITDKDYRIHGSGLNEPGRNFVIAGELRF